MILSVMEYSLRTVNYNIAYREGYCPVTDLLKGQ